MKFNFNGEIVRDSQGKVCPSPEQLGLTFEDMMEWPERQTQEVYDKWNAKRLEHEMAEARVKGESSTVEMQKHWYNRLPKSNIMDAIMKSIPIYPKVMGSIIKSSTPVRLVDYYTNGYSRVTPENISLHPVHFKKLKKFPSFDETTDTLVGSPRQLMVMYMELFPPLIRTKSRIRAEE